jgi:hypothetical protein
LPKMRRKPPDHTTVLRIVAALIFASAVFGVGIAIINAFKTIPYASDLIYAFIESFKAGITGLVGFLAGRHFR